MMRAGWVLGLCAFSAQTFAVDLLKDNSQFFSDYEFEEKPWVEIEAHLPPAPQSQNLVALNTAGTVRHRYLLDRSSVSVGADGVVRFVMVIETAGGARNVSFEGLRCETKESKLYAFGQPGGWAKNRYARWNPIAVRSDTPAALLFKEYFCAGGELPTLERVQDLLKRGGYKH
jgi:hypothetical protein